MSFEGKRGRGAQHVDVREKKKGVSEGKGEKEGRTRHSWETGALIRRGNKAFDSGDPGPR